LRMLLGTVPVEPDGSAYFRAPPGSQSISKRSMLTDTPCKACIAV